VVSGSDIQVAIDVEVPCGYYSPKWAPASGDDPAAVDAYGLPTGPGPTATGVGDRQAKGTSRIWSTESPVSS
jgi:hypothetical protein